MSCALRVHCTNVSLLPSWEGERRREGGREVRDCWIPFLPLFPPLAPLLSPSFLPSPPPLPRQNGVCVCGDHGKRRGETSVTTTTNKRPIIEPNHLQGSKYRPPDIISGRECATGQLQSAKKHTPRTSKGETIFHHKMFFPLFLYLAQQHMCMYMFPNTWHVISVDCLLYL